MIFYIIDLHLLRILVIVAVGGIVNLATATSAEDVIHRWKRQEDDECNKSQFECTNGKCIDIFEVCNGINDCKDGKDENPETCSEWASEASCKIEETVATRFQCEIKGVPITCSEKVRPWTTVIINCNVGYIRSNDTKLIEKNKCLPSGDWLYEMPSCSFECGDANKADKLPENVTLLFSRANFPWTAYLYKAADGQINPEGDPFCLGVLITPFTVVTALNCTRSSTEDFGKNDFLIGFGVTEDNSINLKKYQYARISSIKRSVEYYDVDDDDDVNISLAVNGNSMTSTNSSEITNKNESISQNGQTQNLTKLFVYKFKVAVITLENQVYLNDVVQPICIDTTGTYEFWSSYLHNLMMVDNGIDGFKGYGIEDFDHYECKAYTENDFWEDLAKNEKLTGDEYCLHFPGEREFNDTVPNLDEWINFGTGVTGTYGGRHYLFGILTRLIYLKPKDPSRKWYHTILVFNDVRTKFLFPGFNGTTNIIYESVKEVHGFRGNVTSGDNCIVPYSSGTKYSDQLCSTNETCPEIPTHNFVDHESIVFLYCQENYTLKGEVSHQVCVDGKWEPDDISCIRTCEPLRKIPSVNTYCTYEGKNVSCTENVMAGTTATSICDAGGFNKEFTTYNNTCLHSGNWKDSPEIVEVLCIELCGIVKVEKALISDGKETNSTYHPWNAGIYVEYKKGKFVSICGGTLISKNAVLTAAHCIHDRNGEKFGSRILKVGLGKLYRKFNHSQDFDAQYFDVKNIYMPDVYDGPSSAYVFDIAILELKEAANLNEVIVPACIDTVNKFTVKNYSLGSVVGWGFDGINKEAKPTKVLNLALLPYIDRKQCIRVANQTLNLPIKITKDKFCAFHVEDGKPVIRGGDNGAGITFQFNRRHYIYGVVSTQANNTISMFTNVTYLDHLEFINKVLNRISVKNLASDKHSEN